MSTIDTRSCPMCAALPGETHRDYCADAGIIYEPAKPERKIQDLGVSVGEQSKVDDTTI